jgi:hypothetical protein
MIQSKALGRALAVIGAALLAMALFASAASAKTPAPGYTQFAGCPSPEENPETVACFRSTITGGHFQMGSKNVPIENPMTLSGGWDPTFTKFSSNSKGGLTPVKQKVPGGVIGLTGLTWLLEFLGSEALTLYAVTELAGTPSGGDGIFLPIKVHLINGVLGNNCYVGSTSNPIKLHLITGKTEPPPPNKSIEGQLPKEIFADGLGIFHSNKAIYVDNSFAAPGASGCVLTLFGFIPISINGLVNSQSGLPAAAGTNETVQNTDSELTFSSLVYP